MIIIDMPMPDGCDTCRIANWDSCTCDITHLDIPKVLREEHCPIIAEIVPVTNTNKT